MVQATEIREIIGMVHTARVSVATAATTNMRMKVMMISSTSDCKSEPAGDVKAWGVGSRSTRKTNDADMAPAH
jgi:hypothetical protein